jgi:lysyl-tRNA synthetase class I
MRGKPSALVDTRVIYCGDNRDQLRNLPSNTVSKAAENALGFLMPVPDLRGHGSPPIAPASLEPFVATQQRYGARASPSFASGVSRLF